MRDLCNTLWLQMCSVDALDPVLWCACEVAPLARNAYNSWYIEDDLGKGCDVYLNVHATFADDGDYHYWHKKLMKVVRPFVQSSAKRAVYAISDAIPWSQGWSTMTANSKDEGDVLAALFTASGIDDDDDVIIGGGIGAVPPLIYLMRRLGLADAHVRRSLRPDVPLIHFGWGENGWEQGWSRLISSQHGVGEVRHGKSWEAPPPPPLPPPPPAEEQQRGKRKAKKKLTSEEKEAEAFKRLRVRGGHADGKVPHARFEPCYAIALFRTVCGGYGKKGKRTNELGALQLVRPGRVSITASVAVSRSIGAREGVYAGLEYNRFDYARLADSLYAPKLGALGPSHATAIPVLTRLAPHMREGGSALRGTAVSLESLMEDPEEKAWAREMAQGETESGVIWVHESHIESIKRS